MIKRNQCLRVVRLPWQRDFRLHQLKAFDQQNNSNTIGNHSQWVSLRHTLPTFENIGLPVPSYQYERGLVLISVKNKTSSR